MSAVLHSIIFPNGDVLDMEPRHGWPLTWLLAQIDEGQS